MSILESLKNLNVSEECFNDIMSIVEEMINELNIETEKGALKEREKRAVNALDTVTLLQALGRNKKEIKKAEAEFHKNVQKFAKDKEHVKKHEQQLGN